MLSEKAGRELYYLKRLIITEHIQWNILCYLKRLDENLRYLKRLGKNLYHL